MIELSNLEKDLVKLTKGHYSCEKCNIYPFTGEWHNTIKPLFIKYYGWNPDEDNNYHDYLQCLFIRLFELNNKINDDRMNNGIQVMDIFKASFYKGISNDCELPIERAIQSVCAMIQFSNVIDKDGELRFNLD
jgi:hypothetical protein